MYLDKLSKDSVCLIEFEALVVFEITRVFQQRNTGSVRFSVLSGSGEVSSTEWDGS